MNRKQKIKLLKDLHAGKKTVKDLFPPFRIALIEAERGIWFDVENRKIIKTEKLERYIEKQTQLHPEGVDVGRMDHEEYLIISERLENEY